MAISEIWVDNQNALASDDNSGLPEKPLRTINAALSQVEPGATIVIAPGIYRETVTPVRSGADGFRITIKAAIPHTVFVRGSEILAEGPISAGYHEFDISEFVLDSRNPFSERLAGSRIGGTCGQVFLGDLMLREVGDSDSVKHMPGIWAALDNGTRIAVNIPAHAAPGNLEISVRERLFAPAERGLGWLNVEGIVFERCANQSAASFWEDTRRQCGAVGFRAGHHIRFEGNVVRFAKTIGLDIGIEGGLDITTEDVPHDNELIGNTICDNGEVGACGRRSLRTLVKNNLVERNGCLSLNTVEEAGLKFHAFCDGVIEGNIIRSNEAAGIWLDALWPGARISRNLVVNNVGSGIFVELGADGATVDNNIVAYTRLGDGIYMHDSSDVLIACNLVFGNAHFGIYLRYVSDRPFDHLDGVNRPAECSRNRVLNNLMIDNYRGHICICADGPRSKSNTSDHNHFINGTQWQWEGLGFHRFCLGDNDGDLKRSVLDSQLEAAGIHPDVTQGNAYLTLDQWQALGYDKHSVAPNAFRITSENGAVVKGTVTLGAQDPFLELRLGQEAVSPGVPTLSVCAEDFFGNPRGENSAPGPFAVLDAGHHVFNISPI